MRILLEFLWSVLNNWAGYATSGLLVACFWVLSVWRNRPTPRYVAIGLASLFLLMAFFKAWNDERNKLLASMNEAASLQKTIDGLTKSDISGRIDLAVLGSQPNNSSHAAIIVSLVNQGASSAVDPSSWSLQVRIPSGAIFRGEPITLSDKNLDFCLGPHTAMRFVQKDALYLKLAYPLARNGTAQGMLWFGLRGLTREQLINPDTQISIFATSVGGQKIEVSSSIRSIQSSNLTYFPGIENPRPINISCKENAPY
jgi:hypothetical protein